MKKMSEMELEETKTIHRIPADQVVVEDDRRVDDITPGCDGERKLPFTYSQPHKIIYVPVEHKDAYKTEYLQSTHWEIEEREHEPARLDAKEVREHLPEIIKLCPFHPDDTLILMEEWLHDSINYETCDPRTIPKLVKHLLCSEGTIEMIRESGKIQPASIMPLELDSGCQQLTVVKVLGVEQLPDHVFEEKKNWPWMSKLLVKEI